MQNSPFGHLPDLRKSPEILGLEVPHANRRKRPRFGPRSEQYWFSITNKIPNQALPQQGSARARMCHVAARGMRQLRDPHHPLRDESRIKLDSNLSTAKPANPAGRLRTLGSLGRLGTRCEGWEARELAARERRELERSPGSRALTFRGKLGVMLTHALLTDLLILCLTSLSRTPPPGKVRLCYVPIQPCSGLLSHNASAVLAVSCRSLPTHPRQSSFG